MTKTQYRLVVRQGPIPGQIFECDKNEISIGRDIANDFVLNDAEVSRRHARLTLEGDRYKIEDLKFYQWDLYRWTTADWTAYNGKWGDHHVRG